MSLQVYLPGGRTNRKIKDVSDIKEVVCPGDEIKTSDIFLRGHGTYLHENRLFSSVAGYVTRIDRLVTVLPPRSKYLGQVGDVVIGRVISLGDKRWNVDIRSRLDSVLMLASVHLPGGELRRRSDLDELMMRDFLGEGDLINAEIQAVTHNGKVSLHTRNRAYGKLSQGILIKVNSNLIKRNKIRTHRLDCGATVILGNNGNIWIQTTSNRSNRAINYGGFVTDLSKVPNNERDVISRLKNIIEGLARHKMPLYDTPIEFAYELSLKYTVKELLTPNIMDKLIDETDYKVTNTYISTEDRERKAYADDPLMLQIIALK